MATNKATKMVVHSAAFTAVAARSPEDALAFMLLAAFGISLEALQRVAADILASKDTQVAILAFTAGVQIRGNVVFVGREYGNVRERYADLVIEGPRAVQDQFNFGALHAVGHILAMVADHALAKKILKKAGNCINGEGVTASEAGQVNKEIADNWAVEDKTAMSAWLTGLSADHKQFLNDILEGMRDRSTQFEATMRAMAAPQQGAVRLQGVARPAEGGARGAAAAARPPPAAPP